MSSVMEDHGVSYLHLLMVMIPSTLAAVIVMSLMVTWCFTPNCLDDPVYLKRYEEGLVTLRGDSIVEIKTTGKTLCDVVPARCIYPWSVMR